MPMVRTLFFGYTQFADACAAGHAILHEVADAGSGADDADVDGAKPQANAANAVFWVYPIC